MTLEICRICGSKDNLKHVFSEGSDELVDQIRLCANIQIDALDCLPKYVCNVCEQGLAFSYSLRKRGEETEKKLRQELLENESYEFIEKHEKEEVDETLIEESCDDQFWINDDNSGHFNEHEILIEKVEDTDEDIPEDIPEESYENEQWIGLSNEEFSESSEIIAEPGYEKMDLMEFIYVGNEMMTESDETETQIYRDATFRDLNSNHDTYKNNSIISKTTIKHLKKETLDSKGLVCDLCPKTFKTVSHLNVHKKSHSKEKSYSCDICGKQMRYQGNLRVHMRTIHNNLKSDDLEKSAKKVDFYDQCLDSISDECKAITSIFMHGKCKVFKCSLCDKISHFKASHIAHCRIHLNEKPFQCRFCEKSFRQLATLKEHEVIHSGMRPYQCSMCSSSFLQRSALTKHEFWHTGNKPFECSICGTSFRSRAALRVHERIHTGEKPYRCDICSLKFRERRQVANHKKTCHHHQKDKKDENSVLYHCTWKKCNKKFVQRLTLMSHLQYHLNPHQSGDTFKCGDCHKGFIKAIYMWHHQKLYKGTCSEKIKKRKHPVSLRAPIKYSICEVCGKMFVSPVALVRHRRLHLNLRQYKCTKCQKSFRHQFILDLHMLRHAQSQIEIVPANERFISDSEDELQLKEEEDDPHCPHCFERLSKAELLDHLFCYHDNIVTNRKPKKMQIDCETCGEVFETKSRYCEHIKIHGDKRFHCVVCDKWFSVRYRYDQHMKNHSSERGAFPCPKCNKTYTIPSNLERHIRSTHNGEKRFQCSECGSSFGRADILKMHMAKHSDERNIECDICQKKFKTSQHLHYHKRTHLEKSERPKKPVRIGPKPKVKIQVYMCEFCDKVSHHRTTHLNHLRTHTGEKPFKCSMCDKAFRTTHARSNHMLLHTDQRPHQCKVCGTSFRQTAHLKSHMLIHTGVKRHVCDFCQKAFTMKSNLMVHLRMHTKDMPYKCNKCPQKFFQLSQVKRHKMSHISEGELRKETCDHNADEMGSEFNDSQISLYIDDIIEISQNGGDSVMSDCVVEEC